MARESRSLQKNLGVATVDAKAFRPIHRADGERHG